MAWWRRPLLWSIVIVAVWIVVGGPLGSFQGRLAEVQENDASAWLPADAEATRVSELEQRFVGADALPAVVVIEHPDGFTEADLAGLAPLTEQLGTLPGSTGPASPPIPSADNAAVQLVVPLSDEAEPATSVAQLEATVNEAAPEGSTVYITGPAGFITDLGDAFGDIDTVLLAVTASVVAVILVFIYRSPVLPLVVLLGAGLALGTASAVVYGLASADLILLNGQSQGIMLILVFGAATDYALLIVARYREELSRHRDRFTAMSVAWRRCLSPIFASGATVILALLALLLSDLNSNRGLGPVAALGVASAMLVMLTYLPAALGLLGRAGFWPFRPRYGVATPESYGLWRRVAALVERRDRRVWVQTALVLAVLSIFATQLDADGVPESELVLRETSSAQGQEALARHFPAGAAAPTVVIANAAYAEPVVAALQQVDGVAQVQPTAEQDELVRLEVVLDVPADSDQAVALVPQLRQAVRAVDGADALVGGESAVDYDTRQAAARDQRVIIPLALLAVFVVIALVLRAVLVTVMLVASVVLSFAATVGIAALAFEYVFSFPGADPSIPLFAFIFLVALGVDYSIFLLTRVREEAGHLGTRDGVRVGLTVTGRVITSAGVVLAATFSALWVIPILFLAQIAFLVAVGVLIDTFVVRSLLVPGLCHDIGDRIWWPSALARPRGRPAARA